MLSLIIIGIILNTFLSHVVAKTAEKKDVGYNTTFWCSVFFSPLVGLLLSIASPKNENKVQTKWYKGGYENLESIFLLLALLTSIVVLFFKYIY